MIQPVLYKFETIWQLAAPLPTVWDAIYNTDQWPQWWRGVHSVQHLQAGNEAGLHAKNAYIFKSWLPYQLHVELELVEIAIHRLLRVKSTGELVGEGIFHITENNGVVTVQYNWNVYTEKTWMNIVAPVARPFFYANHNQVMRWGAKGLAEKLGTPLIKFTSNP